MKDDFYMVLLSNSSFQYYPDNTTAHFITKLPQHLTFEGEWSVALTEIHVPLTFQNLSKKGEYVEYSRAAAASDLESGVTIENINGTFTIPAGVYEHLNELIEILNKDSEKSHIRFTLQPGRYVKIEKACKNCPGKHAVSLSNGLRRILGFQLFNSSIHELIGGEPSAGHSPANIYNDLPTNLMIYSDICEPIVTGDVYTSLLRNVALDLKQYSYGGIVSKTFSRAIYVPLLRKSFETIEIDIRDQFGDTAPFDFGTSTLTLHFRRIS